VPKRQSVDEPQLVRGALFTLRRKCGKPTCRCATGEPHETPALAYTEGGRSKTLTLTDADLDSVRAGLARYHRARAELDRAADAGIAALRAGAAARRGRARR
jgi:hypothetical protein